MSEPNNGDPIGDAPDADPELVRDRSGGAASVWRVVVALVAVVLIVALIVFFV